MNQTQRKYLFARIEEERNRKAAVINPRFAGPYWDINQSKLTEIVTDIKNMIDEKYPELRCRMTNINAQSDNSYNEGGFSFLVGPTRAQKHRMETENPNQDRLRQMQLEAKNVCDTVMLGDETAALTMLKEFMEKDF